MIPCPKVGFFQTGFGWIYWLPSQSCNIHRGTIWVDIFYILPPAPVLFPHRAENSFILRLNWVALCIKIAFIRSSDEEQISFLAAFNRNQGPTLCSIECRSETQGTGRIAQRANSVFLFGTCWSCQANIIDSLAVAVSRSATSFVIYIWTVVPISRVRVSSRRKAAKMSSARPRRRKVSSLRFYEYLHTCGPAY